MDILEREHFGLDLQRLEAHDVGRVSLYKSEQAFAPRLDRVDVPGRYLQHPTLDFTHAPENRS